MYLIFMPDITRYFHEKHPEVEISYSYDSFRDLQGKLYNNQLDIAFSTLFSMKDREYLLYNYVEHSVDYILMHKNHPLAKKKTLSLADCRDETFILISPKTVRNPPLISFRSATKTAFILTSSMPTPCMT